MFDQLIIWVRGAGEMASAAAHCLHRVGFGVLMSDLPAPLAIRRTVAFCEAIFTGTWDVEGVPAKSCDVSTAPDLISQGIIPVVIDTPQITTLHPHVMVDGRMLKRHSRDMRTYAPFTVGLGPGFEAGGNCHAAVETMRGHDLGKIIRQGAAQPHTGVPGEVGGETLRRVIHAPADGPVSWRVDFGDLVRENDLLGSIDNTHEIRAPLAGLVRGLISPQVRFKKGLKIADIDPRGRAVDCRTISDKARAVGRGVLEAILVHLREEHENTKCP